MNFLPYGRQCLDEDDERAVLEALRSDFLTTGPRVAEFEKALSDICADAHAVACSNGTTALHLAYMAMGIGPGDTVIVPSLTFLATANAVRYCGADVVFADCDPQTGLMRVQDAEEALARAENKNVKAMACVHLAGQMCDLKGLSDLAKAHNIPLLADGAHALGSPYEGKAAGSCVYEDITTFSFHPVKTIAMGEGGAVTTRHADWAAKMRTLRSHGMTPDPATGPWAYSMDTLGYNYREPDILCALGLSQMKKLESFIKRRQETANLYDELLAPLAPVIQGPVRANKEDPAWHLYALRIDFEKLGITRAEFMAALKTRNIGSQVHYIPVHTQPYYRELYGDLNLPGAQHYYEHTLSIPLYPSMSDEDVHYVADAITTICQQRMTA
ncbi:MAG: UDP-4-amino-4,6-dideoxy-N-acetyl-beta-L-altrosamine transaminase [Alphaproteobacteria bacterium]|nr:UDP-4-amino-4,6-dideoxy-N-acetyl-beta-L-altrosamine transaminase [Alphaproteobacteria bacterium]